MTSEVRARLEFEVGGQERLPGFSLRGCREGDSPLVITDFRTEPSSQIVVTNKGESATLERIPNLPPGVDARETDKELLAELDEKNPEERLPVLSAMKQSGELVVSFIPDDTRH